VRTSPAETGAEVAGAKETLTTTEAALLGLLSHHGELAGYDLHRYAQRGVGYIWGPAKSRIYAVLPRLVARGLATRRGVAQPARPDKQLHRITPAGERALRAWLERDDAATDPFLLRVFFGRLLPADVLRGHVERHRERARARLAEYREIDERIAGCPEDRYGYLTLRWGIAAEEAKIAWADETLRELDA
jgi:DNA-binding PadR family transcriptional regulator